MGGSSVAGYQLDLGGPPLPPLKGAGVEGGGVPSVFGESRKLRLWDQKLRPLGGGRGGEGDPPESRRWGEGRGPVGGWGGAQVAPAGRGCLMNEHAHLSFAPLRRNYQ